MKKLFLFLPALLLSLLANAAVININNSTPNAVQAALNSAASGDEIVMAAGIYEESGNYLAFTGKELTVRATEGAEVIIKTVCPVRLKEGAKAEFINIKFDCSTIGSYDYVIVAADDTENKRVVLTGCEFYGWAKEKAMIEATSSRRLDAITINNCYFHDCMKSVVFVENTGYNDLSITNSTFANITTSENFSAGVIDSRATSGSLLVDHCTFYNVEAMNTDYAAIGKVQLPSGAVVSNCIFALSAPGASSNRTIRDVVAANNCLVYNYTADSGYGMQSNVTKTGCFIADPLFTDAANGDFSLAGNWITMNLSPARGAATDGSNLGDPRWYSAETLPSVDFATPYQFVGAKALLAGKIWYDSENDNLYGDGGSNKDYGTATWKFHAEKAGVVGVAANLNSGNTSGHKLRVEVLDADGNSVGEFAEQTSTLPGTLIIPAAGDYKIILHDDQTWSSAKIDNVTLSYIGGAVQNIASATNTTVDVSEAWYSAGGSRADGKISFPGDLIATSWIRWNVHVADSKYYDITVNFSSDNGHNIGIRLFNDERSIEISEGGQTSAASPLELGRLSIPAGDYTMELTNPVSHSHAQIISVLFAPVAASATELPGTLEFGNAVLSDRAHVTDGKLYFAPIGDTNPVGEWASWTVTTDHYGTFLFTMGVNSTNGQSYKISIYDDTDNLIDAFEKKVSSNTAATIKHYFSLAAGNYSVKVENTTAWSRGYLTSLVVTEPSILTIDETATTNSVINDNYRLDAQDIQIIRTITADMYNTICLPFDVSDADLKATFGNDVELLQMASATIDGAVLDLNFENVTTGIYRGTPYLIKTSRDIVNPIFVDAIIKEKVGQVTSGTAANFIGTFIKTTIPEDPNNLFLGANNNLYFPEGGDMPIKGMRAYFAVTGSSGAPIRQARIVAQGNVATEVELINGQLPSEFGDNDLRKSIENGQLIIIRDGVQYNALGVRVK